MHHIQRESHVASILSPRMRSMGILKQVLENRQYLSLILQMSTQILRMFWHITAVIIFK